MIMGEDLKSRIFSTNEFDEKRLRAQKLIIVYSI